MNVQDRPSVRPIPQAKAPITRLRDGMDALANSDRLASAGPGVELRHQLAGITARLDGRKATLSPRPGGHRPRGAGADVRCQISKVTLGAASPEPAI